MDDRRLVKTSKWLSKHLRHQPARAGLTLQPGGWVSVEDLLAAARAHGLALDRRALDEVVARNDKRRFAYDDAGTRIRATQGHAVPVDLGLAPVTPPPVLLHGTAAATLPAIRAEGLKPMGRHHVHLTADAASALRTGRRHGRPVVLEVDAAAMHAAGHVFLVTANDVWLVDAVPPPFLRERRA